MLLLALPEAGTVVAWKEDRSRTDWRNRKPYYAALKAADIAWEQGHFDVSVMAEYLSGLLKQQLSDPTAF